MVVEYIGGGANTGYNCSTHPAVGTDSKKGTSVVSVLFIWVFELF